MCCFSRPIKHVSATHIFARHLPSTPGTDQRQALIYSMNVEIADELAMVLPIPVAASCGEDAVTFVDLSAYPKLFTDMRHAFPEIVLMSKSRGIFAQGQSRQKLAVHDVGAFVASFVPTSRDFDRLDERFRLSPVVFEAHDEYREYGFAVFQLKPSRGWFRKIKRQTIHPMAFTFPSRRPRALFYPTLHVHDGTVPEKARFDHSLYCQTEDEVLLETLPFERSEKPIGEHVDTARSAGLIDGKAHVLRDVIMWEQKNADHWYDPPPCAGAHVLRGGGGKGELFAFKLCVTAAYVTEFPDHHKNARRWHQSARTKLDALHAALSEGVRTLTAERRDDWNLIPLDATAGTLATARLVNDTLYGDNGLLAVGKESPLRVCIKTFTDDVEPQEVELAFRYVPTPEVISEIRMSLNAIVDRAVT